MPSTARTGIAGQWGGAMSRSLSKAGAPEPTCSCAGQCLLKVEALLQRGLFWAVGYLLVWCFVCFSGLAIVATQKNCISESQTVSEPTWPSEPVPGAGSPSVGADKALRSAPLRPNPRVASWQEHQHPQSPEDSRRSQGSWPRARQRFSSAARAPALAPTFLGEFFLPPFPFVSQTTRSPVAGCQRLEKVICFGTSWEAWDTW